MNPDYNLIKLEHDYRIAKLDRYRQAQRIPRRLDTRRHQTGLPRLIAVIMQALSS